MNFQAVLMFFINGSSFIHLDPFWTYYLIYKSTKRAQIGKCIYTLSGYATTYEFWNEATQSSKTRISQFLILPTHQSKGLGKELLSVLLIIIIGNL